MTNTPDKQQRINPAVVAGFVVGAAAAAAFVYVNWKAFSLPEARPKLFDAHAARATEKKIMVCAGDSHTHGHVGADYVQMLREALPGYAIANAGINGDLAYHVLQRLDEIIALQPDVVTVLIGTNDAYATLSEQDARRYIQNKNLPMWPSIQRYERHLRAIVQRLQTETNARIALISPPVLVNEQPGPINAHVGRYVAIMRQVAAETQVAYLPLHEAQQNYLAKQSQHAPTVAQINPTGSVYAAVVQHYLLGRRWGEISEARGLHLLTDHIHLNERGAAMVAALITEFVREPVQTP